VPDPILKIRPEHETGIGDSASLEAILRALGFEPVMRMEKVRAVWERQELEACLDETPFGCYLELEGEPQAIRVAMEGLGLAPDRAEPRSYPELYVAHGLG
jgi:adenylate cyclase, class 2